MISERKKTVTIEDKERTVALFDEFIRLSNELKKAEQTLEKFRQANLPVIKNQYETFDEYNDDCERKFAYEQRVSGLKGEIKALEFKRNQAEADIKNVIPTKIWFKHGNNGIGIAYSNWGGSKWYVKVIPWQEKMPSLDETYRGD